MNLAQMRAPKALDIYIYIEICVLLKSLNKQQQPEEP